MKKRFIMLILLLLITGCKASYTLEINDGEYKEKLNIVEKNATIFDKNLSNGMTVLENFENFGYSDQESDNEIKIKRDISNEKLEMNIEGTSGSLFENFSIMECYSDPDITTDDEEIYFDSGDEFTCFDDYENLDELKITIKTKNKVEKHNANFHFGNTYVWNIKKNGNKKIIFDYYVDLKKDYKFVSYIAIGFVTIVILILLYIFVKKRMKRNEI